MKLLLSRIFLIAGLLLFLWGGFLVWRRFDPRWLALAQKGQNTSRNIQSARQRPTGISISRLNIDLPIYGAKIIHGNWEDTTLGVSYLLSSPVPGEVGNSVLYGHNWSTLLGPITNLRPGDTITIRYSSGDPKIFTVQFVNTVTPDQTYILKPTADRRITLYTCTGFLDSKRLVVTALLDNPKLTILP